MNRRERIALWLHRTLDKRFSRLAVALYQRTNGSITERVHVDGLTLTTVGRKSGRQRSVLLQYFPEGDDMLLVAADGGGDHHPGWYHNLGAKPEATVQIGSDRIPVRAQVLDPSTADSAWHRILETAPEYERYRRATERTIPIVRLHRI